MPRPLTKLLIIGLTAFVIPLGLTVGLKAAPVAHAATAACYDSPGNDDCNNVSTYQVGQYGNTCREDEQEVRFGNPDTPT